jgi:hypothetical protein
MELLQHSVEWNGQRVSVEIEGFTKTDLYATNLELTGMANWFGSMNVCNMLAEHAADFFGEAVESDSSTGGAKEYCFLELGSGLGRAGLMALKLMALEGRFRSRCVLSDGEEEIVQLLRLNYARNFPSLAGSSHVPCICQYLRWGPGPGLRALQSEFADGFDLIVGCDLIYGPESPAALLGLLLSVDLLLSTSSGGGRARERRRTEEAQGSGGGEEPAQRAASGEGTGIEADAGAETGAGVRAEAGAETGAGVRAEAGAETETETETGAEAGTDTGANTETGTEAGTEAGAEAGAETEAAEGLFSIQQRPAFYLAVTRRDLLPLDELRLLALSCGLHMLLLEDYTFDIFDTCVDANSMFWRDTILRFTRT